MKATSGLLALGMFTLAGVITISCGGSSDDGDTDNTAGKTSTAGKGSGGGSSGSTSTAGKTGGGGTANSAGTSTGGSNGSNGGRNNQGGSDNPGAGGAFNIEECGDGVIDGMPCERMQGGTNACQLDDTTYCSCQGRNNPTWFCLDSSDVGQGGAGGGIFGDVTCPANVKTGDTCTGLGPCPGSQTCACAGGTAYCGQQ